MTNEEIKAKVDDLYLGHIALYTHDHITADDIVPGLLDFARALVSQAYEEAAQIADNSHKEFRPKALQAADAKDDALEGAYGGISAETRLIAHRIRALKDSLSPTLPQTLPE